MTTAQLYKLFLQHPLISTDTRKILAGSLFFALKGENFDANTFAAQAIEAGAAYAVIDNAACRQNDKYILVGDVLTVLQNLARYHRRQLNIPVIGLTGSNGKTTTKELINSVLSQHFKTLATQGNLNNHIGVPLTILSINGEHEIAVIEIGANHQKEIDLLCSIALPTHGLITNVGKAHLEGFGGIEGVRKGKGELYDFLAKAESPVARKPESLKARGIPLHKGVFINRDDHVLLEMQQERGLQNAVYYGTGHTTNNLVTGEIIDNSPFLSINWINSITGNGRKGAMHFVPTHLTGAYNLHNILAAICIGVYFGLADDEIQNGIEAYQPKNNRSQIVQTAANTLICDYYNANPGSMAAAIDNIRAMDAYRKVLILGDMFEMGDDAAVEHGTVIKKAMETPADKRIFIGKEFYLLRPEARKSGSQEEGAAFYLTADDAIIALKANPIKNSTILIKGSRGMALERLVELF